MTLSIKTLNYLKSGERQSGLAVGGAIKQPGFFHYWRWAFHPCACCPVASGWHVAPDITTSSKGRKGRGQAVVWRAWQGQPSYHFSSALSSYQQRVSFPRSPHQSSLYLIVHN